jgi:hypothetical protein
MEAARRARPCRSSTRSTAWHLWVNAVGWQWAAHLPRRPLLTQATLHDRETYYLPRACKRVVRAQAAGLPGICLSASRALHSCACPGSRRPDALGPLVVPHRCRIRRHGVSGPRMLSVTCGQAKAGARDVAICSAFQSWAWHPIAHAVRGGPALQAGNCAREPSPACAPDGLHRGEACSFTDASLGRWPSAMRRLSPAQR